MQQSERVEGQCHCGKIQFEIELPVFGVIYCHCFQCRSHYGGDYSTWVRVVSQNFSLSRGESDLQKFSISDSSSSYFCKVCSSTVYTEDLDYPDSYGVLRGMIKNDIGQTPSSHFFYDQRQAWVEMNDDLPKFGGESGFEPI